MQITAGTLSRGEKLLLERRREGLTQPEAAKKRKVSTSLYRLWESDKETEEAAPSVALGAVEVSEACFIARRRSGKTVAQVARALRVCRFWLYKMERGEAPTEQLAEYWALT